VLSKGDIRAISETDAEIALRVIGSIPVQRHHFNQQLRRRFGAHLEVDCRRSSVRVVLLAINSVSPRCGEDDR
jgi:hypothetical protein